MKQKILNILKIILLLILFFNIGSIVNFLLGLIGLNKALFNYNDAVYLEALCESLLFIAVVVLYRKTLNGDFTNLRKDFNISEFLKFLCIFLVVKIVSSLVTGIISIIIGIDLTVSENQNIINVLSSLSPILMLITSAFLAPLVEEGIFRLGFRQIIKDQYIFILISSLVFGLMHIFPTELPLAEALTYGIVYVSIGAALSWTYVKSNNIWYVILIHAINNFLSMLVLL
jgi:uncharacterized protein